MTRLALATVLVCAACGDDSSPSSDSHLDAAVHQDASTGGNMAADAGLDAQTSTTSDSSTTSGDAGSSTANLIVNGNAEAAPGSTDATPVATPPWTSTGEATALTYGVSSYPSRGDVETPDPGPADRGDNLFIGGEGDELSTLAQSISLAAYAGAIDASRVSFKLDGWLGGFSDQEDNDVLTITFKDASDTAIGTGTIGPVTATDRQNITSLLEVSTTGAVPAGARTVDVLLTSMRLSGSANDGYADDLSLVLTGI